MNAPVDEPESPSETGPPELVWQFVAIEDYALPRLPVTSAVQSYWASLARRFSQRPEAAAPVKRTEELTAFDRVALSHLIRELDWAPLAEALDEALDGGPPATGSPDSVRVVVGQPHGGHAEIVRCWGERHRATCIEPPDPARIRTADLGWLDRWSNLEGLWVLPELERCYLRTPDGLDLIRRFLDAAENGRLGSGVIGCDSFAWAYLRKAWPVPHLDALTLQALDGAQLSRLFARLTITDGDEHVRYQNARTGQEVLVAPDDGPDVEPGPELVQLAAQARGNLGVALEHWRAQLRTEPEMPPGEAAIDDEARDRVVWVSSTPIDPVMPLGKEDEPDLILHSLLLHGGLPDSALAEVVPLSRSLGRATLTRLRDAGLVARSRGRWIVPALAHAAVRARLNSRDYLVDSF